MSYQEFRKEHPDEWDRCPLVLSLTGDWTADSHLNASHLDSRDDRKIIYGWTEPHACAGHAVLIAQQGGCLACHLDGTRKIRSCAQYLGGRDPPEGTGMRSPVSAVRAC